MSVLPYYIAREAHHLGSDTYVGLPRVAWSPCLVPQVSALFDFEVDV